MEGIFVEVAVVGIITQDVQYVKYVELQVTLRRSVIIALIQTLFILDVHLATLHPLLHHIVLFHFNHSPLLLRLLLHKLNHLWKNGGILILGLLIMSRLI